MGLEHSTKKMNYNIEESLFVKDRDITTDYCKKVCEEIEIDFKVLETKFDLTIEEISFLKGRFYFPYYEYFKDKKGIKIAIDPICVAVLDSARGAELFIINPISAIIQNSFWKLKTENEVIADCKEMIEMCKSIIGKINPKIQERFFID